MHLSFGKSSIFWYPNAPRSLRQVTRLKIVLRTTELALITQRPVFLRLIGVILLPLCATLSRQHVFLIYQKLLELYQYLGRDQSWKDCLIYVLLCLISMKKFMTEWMLLQHLKYHLLSLLQQLDVYKSCYFRGLGLVIPFIHIFAANSATVIILLILIQLEDVIFSSDVTVVSAFTMFSWSLFFNSGSSSFTGLIDWLSHNHVFSED